VKRFELLTNTNFDVMGKKWVFIVISAVAVGFSIAALLSRGLNYGIDFRGGNEVRVKFRTPPAVEQIRGRLEALRLGDVNIQRLGLLEERELMIRVEQEEGKEGGQVGAGDVSQQILAALRPETDQQAMASGRLNLNEAGAEEMTAWLAAKLESERAAGTLPAGTTANPKSAAEAIVAARDETEGIFASMEEVRRVPGVPPEILGILEREAFLGEIAPRSVDYVGASAGADLIRKAQYAVGGSCIGILAYIWIRFRFIWGVAGVVALVHDVLIAMGGLALTQKEFTLPVVAALLTIVGFSINDTVVVFDRIRENLRIYRGHDYETVVNGSINQTFSRTILTSFTVLLSTTALYLFGGDKLDALSFTLLVGFLSGSYSSIFVASPILVLHQQWWESRRRRS
jgi:preprotein translocase subunit SecF